MVTEPAARHRLLRVVGVAKTQGRAMVTAVPTAVIETTFRPPGVQAGMLGVVLVFSR
jgi:hypothetical protein